jgi:hypothetical protein
MRYYVETQTWRFDKTERWSRLRVDSYEEAQAVAKEIAAEAFYEQCCTNCDFRFGARPVFVNDFGELVSVRVTTFGDSAQVREGDFTI